MDEEINPKDIIIVSNTSDNAFAEDISHFFGKHEEVGDIIALKQFANTEFCPRFICDEDDMSKVGKYLEGKIVVIISTHDTRYSRNDIAMRNMILARTAKDNNAKKVMLIEPDLFYSAQDRGPQRHQGDTQQKRSDHDLYKFNGQSFTALLYANLLKEAGVDQVMTIHNHSFSTQKQYKKVFGEENFKNIIPYNLYSKYLVESKLVNPEKLVLCAPDAGALDFIHKTKNALHEMFGITVPIIQMTKTRTGEEQVKIEVDKSSELTLDDIEGKDIVIIDDMVRSGATIVNTCNALQEGNPRQNIFIATHFYASDSARKNLSTKSISEIITTNTLPFILNRDSQGRLRKKMAVLKIGRWISHYLKIQFGMEKFSIKGQWYQEDLSSRHPRSKFNYYLDSQNF
jgi:ribose-phosphate pyrophosphokinase